MELLSLLLGKNNAKSIIIDLLSDESLSAKEIYSKAKKRGWNGTFQGIFKGIKELNNKGIITKSDGKKYSISEAFLNSVEVMIYKSKLSKIKSLNKKGELLEITFSSQEDLDRFFSVLDRWFLTFENISELYGVANHLWWPILKAGEEHDLKNFRNSSLFAVVKGNTKLDQYCVNFYRSIGANVCSAPELKGIPNFWIYKEWIFEIFSNEQVVGELDNIFETTDEINADTVIMIKKALKNAGPAKIVCMYNKYLAKQRKQMVSSILKSQEVET